MRGCDVLEAGGGPGRTRVKSPTEIPTEARQARRQALLRQTLLLMLTLLLLGAAGLTALGLLHYAMRTPNADDTAALICTAYKTQNYDALIARVDPNYRGQIGPSNPFDNNAKNQLKNLLISADRNYGKVTTCSYSETSDTRTQAGEAKIYNVVILRATQTQPVTLIETLVKESDGKWYITRGSAFALPQTGP